MDNRIFALHPDAPTMQLISRKSRFWRRLGCTALAVVAGLVVWMLWAWAVEETRFALRDARAQTDAEELKWFSREAAKDEVMHRRSMRDADHRLQFIRMIPDDEVEVAFAAECEQRAVRDKADVNEDRIRSRLSWLTMGGLLSAP